MARLGGICSILAGVIYVISGMAFFFYQVNRFDWNSIASISAYFQTVPEAELMWGIVNLGATLASFLAVAGVLALSDRLRPFHEGFVRWTSLLAIIGYSVLAISDVADFYMVKRLAVGYPQLDLSARAALEASGVGSLDPASILRFITIGPWFLVAGWLSIRHNRLPKALAWLGFIAGVAALGFVVVRILEIEWLAMPAILITLVFHPIWLIWTGIVLWRDR